MFLWAISSVGRAPDLHPGGHRFDPDMCPVYYGLLEARVGSNYPMGTAWTDSNLSVFLGTNRRRCRRQCSGMTGYGHCGTGVQARPVRCRCGPLFWVISSMVEFPVRIRGIPVRPRYVSISLFVSSPISTGSSPGVRTNFIGHGSS